MIYFEAVADLIENGLPFQKMPGIRVAEIVEGRARLFIPFREDLIGDARPPRVSFFKTARTGNALHLPHIPRYEKKLFLMHSKP
ncbi:hypothetical protein [Solidesulfovibrio fructosivorans]|uniref:hypothetical protein n=1 Tax=Solidesulfovibrio fructosivorans TaxID=878 RepID=UPI00031C4602|nr:hypothetical protein [Solidesulfovibrio fructosivorans]